MSAHVQKALDRLAISVSALCAVHCLLAPMLLILVPVLSATMVSDERFHRMLLWLIVPASCAALLLGCYRHKDRAVMVFGVLGVAALILIGHFGHELLGETGERFATVLGAAVLSAGHVRNYKLCREHECREHECRQ
jgi:hypothetical protein